MFEDFMNDRCDIYHLRSGENEEGYGIRTPTAHYPDEPDESDVPCHFNRAGAWEGLTESPPYRMYPGATKLQLPLYVDVRQNDRIVDRETGIEYTASVPRVVGRRHHRAVRVNRMPIQERL